MLLPDVYPNILLCYNHSIVVCSIECCLAVVTHRWLLLEACPHKGCGKKNRWGFFLSLNISQIFQKEKVMYLGQENCLTLT